MSFLVLSLLLVAAMLDKSRKRTILPVSSEISCCIIFIFALMSINFAALALASADKDR